MQSRGRQVSSGQLPGLIRAVRTAPQGALADVATFRKHPVVAGHEARRGSPDPSSAPPRLGHASTIRTLGCAAGTPPSLLDRLVSVGDGTADVGKFRLSCIWHAEDCCEDQIDDRLAFKQNTDGAVKQVQLVASSWVARSSPQSRNHPGRELA